MQETAPFLFVSLGQHFPFLISKLWQHPEPNNLDLNWSELVGFWALPQFAHRLRNKNKMVAESRCRQKWRVRWSNTCYISPTLRLEWSSLAMGDAEERSRDCDRENLERSPSKDRLWICMETKPSTLHVFLFCFHSIWSLSEGWSEPLRNTVVIGDGHWHFGAFHFIPQRTRFWPEGR